MDDRLQYGLTEDQHERIFQNEILPVYFRPSIPLPAIPTAIVLGGQPGSGKSGLLVAADKRLRQDGRSVVINEVDLRSFHPAYDRMQTEDQFNAAHLTDQDCTGWAKKLFAAAAAERVSMVIKSTMRCPEAFRATAANLFANGYRVEAHALAVPEALSWQGIHLRYEKMLSQGCVARFTAKEAHYAAATGMLETLCAIEKDHLADRVRISDRKGQVLYDNRLTDDVWQRVPRAANIVMAERGHPRTLDEQREIAATWRAVIRMMRKRAADPAAIDRVRQTARIDAADLPSGQAPALDLATRPSTPFIERLLTWRESKRVETVSLPDMSGSFEGAKPDDHWINQGESQPLDISP